MKVHLYTDREIEILKSNKYVLDVKYKREISYDPLFKLMSIMMRVENSDLSAREIFELGGFDTNILHPKLPRSRIRDWYLSYERYGYDYFIDDIAYFNVNRKNDNKNKEESKYREFLLNYIIKHLENYFNGRKAYTI